MQRPEAQGGVPLGTHTWFGMTFNACFPGAALVDWLVHRFPALTRTQACAVGEDLRRAFLLRHSIKRKAFAESCFYFWAKSLDPVVVRDGVAGGTGRDRRRRNKPPCGCVSLRGAVGELVAGQYLKKAYGNSGS